MRRLQLKLVPLLTLVLFVLMGCGGDRIEIPSAFVTIDGSQHEAASLGGTWTDDGTTYHGDSFGIISTPDEPMQVNGIFDTTFSWSPHGNPDAARLTIYPRDALQRTEVLGPDRVTWGIIGEPVVQRDVLTVEDVYATTLELEPGLYVLYLTAEWERGDEPLDTAAFGNIAYAIAVEVKA